MNGRIYNLIYSIYIKLCILKKKDFDNFTNSITEKNAITMLEEILEKSQPTIVNRKSSIQKKEIS